MRGSSSEALLKGVDAEYREEVAHAVEVAQRAAETWTAAYTDFLTPPVAAAALQVSHACCCSLFQEAS